MAQPRPDPIRHVVVLILENHSFDQMLGCFTAVHPGLEGIDPQAPRQNSDDAGRSYFQAPTNVRQMLLDPHHEVRHVAVQLADGNGGFVKDFQRCYPESSPDARQLVMNYYPLDFLPSLHALARDFTICDHWFSALPGPTWPNRFFALTGTSNGRVRMPGDGEGVDPACWFEQDQPTLFDRLNEKNVNWKCYFHDVPQSAVLDHQRRPHNAARYFYVDEFFDDARGREDEFPQFCLIEPDFNGVNENDDHPPHDVMKAEKLIADVYNALRANGTLWQSTLLVVFYDEHGGFYDHVVPPPAVPPDGHREEYTFDQYGLRVPALLVSPWVDRRVESTRFDHTSLLRYFIDKWDLDPLGRRTDTAASIGVALTRTAARGDRDMVARIELAQDQLASPDPATEEEAFGKSVHHTALQAMTAYLKEEAAEDLPRLYAWLIRGLEAAKSCLEGRLDCRYGVHVSIAELDKVTTQRVPVREAFGRFLGQRKRQAVPALGAIVRSSASEEMRAHAAHTLALVSGRSFHRRQDKVRSATEWLDRHRR